MAGGDPAAEEVVVAGAEAAEAVDAALLAPSPPSRPCAKLLLPPRTAPVTS
jgi:hypothetical protein